VLICCWSSKGGVGTTVVAAALAITAARSSPAGALLADLAGDAPAVLGLPADTEPGLAGWLAAAPSVPADALARLEVPVGHGLAVLPRGAGPLAPAGAELLAAALAADPRTVIADVGVLGGADRSVSLDVEVALALAAGATRSLLVLRPCFLALRRALVAPVRPSGVVVVVEEGRALTALDVEEALGVPVLAEVRVTPQVARAVDAGILASRLPRTLERDLRHAA
jgi:hypothetical protein